MIVPGDVCAALDELGIAYTVSGNNAHACCPYHDERRPSWGINTETGLWNCFGCGAKGNFSMLLRHETGMTSIEAQMWMTRRAGRRVERKKREREELDESSLWKFGEPSKNLCLKRGFTIEDAIDYNLLWDEQESSWIIPIRDPKTGKLWGWQQKSEDGRFFKNCPRLVNKSATLFGYSIVRAQRPDMVVLVESPLDAVRLWGLGYYAVASFGANVSAEQLRLIADVTHQLVLFLDRDNAGLKNMARIKKEFHLIPTFVFNYNHMRSGEKDPGEAPDHAIHTGMVDKTLITLTSFDDADY